MALPRRCWRQNKGSCRAFTAQLSGSSNATGRFPFCSWYLFLPSFADFSNTISVSLRRVIWAWFKEMLSALPNGQGQKNFIRDLASGDQHGYLIDTRVMKLPKREKAIKVYVVSQQLAVPAWLIITSVSSFKNANDILKRLFAPLFFNFHSRAVLKADIKEAWAKKKIV